MILLIWSISIFYMFYWNFKHACPNEKYFRANHSNFISKKLLKAITTQFRVCNKYLRDKTKAWLKSSEKTIRIKETFLSVLRKANDTRVANLNKKSLTKDKSFGKLWSFFLLLKLKVILMGWACYCYTFQWKCCKYCVKIRYISTGSIKGKI